jgi:hypothetical protein
MAIPKLLSYCVLALGGNDCEMSGCGQSNHDQVLL